MQDGCCPLLAIDTLSIAPFRLFFYLITAAFLFACLCFCQTLSLSVKYNCRRRRTVLMSPIATRPTHKINNYFVHLITPLCLSLHLSLLICSSCPLSRSEVGIIHGADSHPKIQQKIEIKKLENNRNEKDAFSRLDKNGIKQKTKKRHYDDDLRGHLIKKIKKTKRKL